MRDFRKLKAFGLADELAVQIYQTTETFPKQELFQLTRQMRTAALSVPANIVEGSARHTLADYCRFLDMALGSLKELCYYIRFAHRMKFLDTQRAKKLANMEQEAAKCLSALILALRKKKD